MSAEPPSALLSIGAFAAATGLSVTALRHYDEIGLLTPADVDPATGYRRYAPEQVTPARTVCSLRAVDLPVEEVRSALAGPVQDLPAVLERHRERLLQHLARLRQQLSGVEEFGTYRSDRFFLLTFETPDEGRDPAPIHFGLLVDDVDAVHAGALAAGGREVDRPADYAWKPRTSCVADPAGHLVDRTQG